MVDRYHQHIIYMDFMSKLNIFERETVKLFSKVVIEFYNSITIKTLTLFPILHVIIIFA